MKKSVLLWSVVLLAFSASVQASGLEMDCGMISINVIQISEGDSCLIPPLAGVLPRPCLIPPIICSPCPIVPLCPSPCLMPNPSLSLLCHTTANPSVALLMLEMQVGMMPSLHGSSLAVLMNMH
jgi:hypothetical protein